MNSKRSNYKLGMKQVANRGVNNGSVHSSSADGSTNPGGSTDPSSVKRTNNVSVPDPSNTGSPSNTESPSNTGSTGKPGVDIRKMKKTSVSGAVFSSIIVVIMLFAGYLYLKAGQDSIEEISISEVLEKVQEEEVEEIFTSENKVFITVAETDGDDNSDFYAYLPENMEFIDVFHGEGLKLSDISVDISEKPITRVDWVDLISVLFMALLAVGVFLFVKNMQSSGGKLLDFGQSKARLIWGKKSKMGFKDVAGIKESKNELIEIVQFLKEPKRFTKLGARIPKGVLLVGPPGSGKTLLARAVAGEAGVPFFHTSGSEFEEMLVGAGASRVRDLFRKARKAAPCIIFIDEIDAVAKKRGTTLHSGNTEQTLNQILVEMDGLEPRVNVIIMAATNRPDVLDPAILRPGRFDRHVVLTLPDVHERKQILEIHSKNKIFAKNVNLTKIARRTVGFSGADLENTLNEAAIMAAKNDQKSITMKDLEEAALKVRYGPERKSKKREEEDIKMTAYHEAGHALVAYYSPYSDPVDGVSIISRGISLGMTMLLPEKDRDNTTLKQIQARISVCTAGRVAEKIVFDDISTGASNDIKMATEMAQDMVRKYGMSSKLGFIQYGNLDADQYIGYGYERQEYSDETARDIDVEVQRIVSEALSAAEKILLQHREELNDLSEFLIKKEVIDGKEFHKFLESRKKKKDQGK